MPLQFPFKPPYYYKNYNKNIPKFYQPPTLKPPLEQSEKANKKEPNTKKSDSFEYFFELFGIKLFFDDILIICILFFLYKEEVKDFELFLCLIMLLIS